MAAALARNGEVGKADGWVAESITPYVFISLAFAKGYDG